MQKDSIKMERERLNVWLLHSQVKDLEKIKSITGKTMTDVISEAVAIYLSKMREWGVL